MTKFKYDEAMSRLQEISSLLEGEIKDINQVSALVKESAELIKKCKKQLKETSSAIEDTLNKIDEPLA